MIEQNTFNRLQNLVESGDNTGIDALISELLVYFDKEKQDQIMTALLETKAEEELTRQEVLGGVQDDALGVLRSADSRLAAMHNKDRIDELKQTLGVPGGEGKQGE
jgi:hypothetical protein